LHAVFFGDECRPDMEFPVFQALVSAGADRAIKNHDGSTAFDLATLNGYPEECLKLLDPGGASNPGNGPVA
jgi:ankyrin repeat protein